MNVTSHNSNNVNFLFRLNSSSLVENESGIVPNGVTVTCFDSCLVDPNKNNVRCLLKKHGKLVDEFIVGLPLTISIDGKKAKEHVRDWTVERLRDLYSIAFEALA